MNMMTMQKYLIEKTLFIPQYDTCLTQRLIVALPTLFNARHLFIMIIHCFVY